MRVLAIGSSHLTAIARGYRDFCSRHPAPFELASLQLQKPDYRPFSSVQGKRTVYNQNLLEDVRAALADAAIRHVVCAIGGNAHNEIGLVNDPRPFDLLLPGATVDDIRTGAEALPYDVVAASIRQNNTQFLSVLQLVKSLAGDRPVLQLCPPPPIENGELILSRPASFREALERDGISPARLRWKLWRTYCNVLAESCAELGIACLEPPEASIDHAGFLREDLWGSDPTHANQEYGALVIEQLAEKLVAEMA